MTWTAVGLLVVAAAVQVELWPLTAYRLFSDVRTATTTTIDLVAVAEDGTRTPVRLDPRNPVVLATGGQYAQVPGEDPEVQRAKVRAWLSAAGVDVADVATTRLERVVLELDAGTGARRETSRELLVEVVP
ncbi:hypothetical protein [Cellulomonas phragmiteti]|uniref:Uncharacterized protein n=1 Tax=Cellulomonas phragmiteti TaxID=478780 RepID=A0ABQ4DQ20_9CELL|nr:hypothetical protein [Cellulomonas phragmiteti]GIG41447.1 hypothetical protein Cph01nite_32090 [Cellulomonas phragmiteti]